MGREKRTFSKEEKISILEEAKKKGVNVTLEKHGVYPGTYYSWNLQSDERLYIIKPSIDSPTSLIFKSLSRQEGNQLYCRK